MMITVILEVYPTETGKGALMALASQLLELINEHPGLISIERFQSMMDEHRLLSLSFWQSTQDVDHWHQHLKRIVAEDPHHRDLIRHYRLRICKVMLDESGDQARLSHLIES
ncbi:MULTISPECIES: antibiotic biosynthesis monooxygenase [Ferrimonas]|uniref:antibiotic biosynthesis monooxygenase family protein n=1 Tax=Ferrimonas TaxID=44011 RepID=UPI00146CC2F6|nr:MULTISPECIES: antibiotic biosynthesis monooxygenase family protein [Ferrimonas]USD38888.1 antibiotic biosynthesis monooxygenase [Ferrimonas sp. SCSIO 43195]